MTLHESSLRIILRDNFKGGFFMSEKMLVTQALDERDLLVKKISDKIDKASFVDTIKPNEDRQFCNLKQITAHQHRRYPRH